MTTSITPYLCVMNARKAIEWYAEVFAATERMAPIISADGRVGHAEIVLGNSVIMIADPYPEVGVDSPAPGRGAAVTLHMVTKDIDRIFQGAAEAGATIEREPHDTEVGRIAVLRDPFGHRWLLSDVGPLREG